jgi:cation transport regulator ChaC
VGANTVAANRTRHHHAPGESLWLFGYGSLIFKADFPWREKRAARIHGWTRRFWQGSHDHRGTPSSPGRVVTLVKSPGADCDGMAYRIDSEVLAHLDYREKNGYLRFMTAVTFPDGEEGSCLVYVATADNAAWLGPATESEIARHIAGARGPSGRNADYLLALADALRAMSATDTHVFTIEKHLRRELSAD